MSHFRNYAFLDLGLEPGQIVLVGDNGQGKTNFLEAIYLLALTRSFRPGPEKELISWQEPAFARLSGQFQSSQSPLKLEMLIQSIDGQVEKRIKLNEKVRQAKDIVGLVNVVFFGPQELEIVLGPPDKRRRYLNILACQLFPRYLEALYNYRLVLKQRNSLLKQINEGGCRASELEVWDERLIQEGSFITALRVGLVNKLNEKIGEIPRRLSMEELKICYRASIEGEGDEIALKFRKALQKFREKEMAFKETLCGPHRDELRFLLGGRDLAITGSRGQQRAAVIGLKLAEGEILREKSGEPPILLLDDIFSELDPLRCLRLAEELSGYQQVIITTTRKSPELPLQATWFQVKDGALFRI